MRNLNAQLALAGRHFELSRTSCPRAYIQVGPDKARWKASSTQVTIGASIFVIAVGAILYFAADVHVAHVSTNTIGLILMFAGLVGLVIGLIQQAIWARATR